MTYNFLVVNSHLRHALKWLLGLLLVLSVAFVSTTNVGAVTNDTKPSIGASFRLQINEVWKAISTNSEDKALKNFFPGGAYVQMKQGVLANPPADFSSRLLAFFKLDFAAYHQLIVTGGESKFIGVRVNPAQISWIPVGACENKIGYWHVGPVRIVYEQAGAVKSFAIASLISWNGDWKIIHLGPNPRAKNIGTVASPAIGPGSPGPGGGC